MTISVIVLIYVFTPGNKEKNLAIPHFLLPAAFVRFFLFILLIMLILSYFSIGRWDTDMKLTIVSELDVQYYYVITNIYTQRHNKLRIMDMDAETSSA